MDWELVRLWNETINPSDTVYHLGDVSLNKNRAADFVPKLNGLKILIPGNHDKCWSMSERWVEFYKTMGFNDVQRHMILEIAGQKVNLTHMPYKSQQDIDQRYMEDRLEDQGSWLLHGHCHGRHRMKNKQIDVGVDAWEMRPISISIVEQLIYDNPDGNFIPNPKYDPASKTYT
jgi:calcineurin-like phosphoesterase family protein